jgi:hypothetical protein
MALFCAPWLNWQGNGTTARPAKGRTFWTDNGTGDWRRVPPLYRNPAFFSSGGEPNTTFCTATSTGATPGGKGRVQAGDPITGVWSATTTGAQKGGFNFLAAGKNGAGIRTTGQVGEFGAIYPYLYRYTYATLRNEAGYFAPGSGPGDFSVVKKEGGITVARLKNKAGAAKFGGTMTMLGALTNKACYYRNGGCLLKSRTWRYDAIGTSASTYNGVVTNGQVVTFQVYCYPPTQLTANITIL